MSSISRKWKRKENMEEAEPALLGDPEEAEDATGEHLVI